jgi:hypothetical protein
MPQPPGLKVALKRGALLTAANWPLVAVQFIAESTLKLLLAVPVVGGVALVVLLLDAEAGTLLAGDLRLVFTAVIGALRENPAALAAFVLSSLIVLVGGSILTFVVKSGTVVTLAQAEAFAGSIERPPLRLHQLKRANRTAIEPFLEACRRFWRRYVRLGLCLLLLYGLLYGITLAAATYLGLLIGGYAMADNVAVLLGGTVIAVAVSSILFILTSVVNLIYLLTQMVMAVEDVSVRRALWQVFRFGRERLSAIAGIFGVVLVLVVLAVVASILGAFGLGFISWVPGAALAVLPLQVAAWLLRGFVFQYLALTALGAYLTQYRHYQHGTDLTAIPGQRLA